MSTHSVFVVDSEVEMMVLKRLCNVRDDTKEEAWLHVPCVRGEREREREREREKGGKTRMNSLEKFTWINKKLLAMYNCHTRNFVHIQYNLHIQNSAGTYTFMHFESSNDLNQAGVEVGV